MMRRTVTDLVANPELYGIPVFFQMRRGAAKSRVFCSRFFTARGRVFSEPLCGCVAEQQQPSSQSSVSPRLLHHTLIIFVPIIMLALGCLAVWLVAVFFSLASIECLKNGKLRLVSKSAHTRSQTATFRPPSARRDRPDQQPRLQWPTAAC